MLGRNEMGQVVVDDDTAEAVVGGAEDFGAAFDEFMAKSSTADEAADEAQDASGEADRGDEEDQEAEEQDDPSDDEGAPEKKPAAKQAPDRLSKVVQKLTKKERELTAAQNRIKELEEAARAPRRSKADLSDRVELVRNAIAEALGVDPTDKSVEAELSEAATDLMLELARDAADADPKLKERMEKRKSEAKMRAERRELEERMNRLERERVEAQQQAFQAKAVATIGGYVTTIADKVPFLMASDEGDPAAQVYEVVQAWAANGTVNIRSDEDAVKAVDLAARRLDEVYRQKAGRYAKLLGKSEEKPVEKREPKPKKKQGYTATDKGASGKNRAVVEDEGQDEDDDIVSAWTKYRSRR